MSLVLIKSLNLPFGPGWKEGRATHIWKWYICATQSLKRSLRSSPSLKMGGGRGAVFQNWSTREKKWGGGVAKNNTETFFLKEDLFELHRSKTWSGCGGGVSGAHTVLSQYGSTPRAFGQLIYVVHLLFISVCQFVK